MPRKNLFFLSAFCIFVFSTCVFGQKDSTDQTTADENFKLNITNKQVTETNYKAKVEVAVELKSAPEVAVGVGAKVEAQKITLTLKNIFGDVRFRGSLEKILNQINLRRPPIDNQ